MGCISGRLLGVVVGICATFGICATVAVPAVGLTRTVDWDTYGVDNQRTGFNPAENALGPPAVKAIHQIWSTPLGAPILAQPVVATRVNLHHPRRVVDLIYAATEHGRIAAMDAETGRVVWSRELGYNYVSFCGDLPNHAFGITGTAVIDRGRNSIFSMGGNGTLYELDLADGQTKRRWQLTNDPTHNYDYGALLLSDGMIYVPFAGNCDTDPYHGMVAAVRVSDGRRIASWLPDAAAGGGGIWGYGGVSADPGGSIFAAVGNSRGPSRDAGYGEHIVRLTSGLGVVSANYPGLPPGDADFGATPLLFQRRGCPPQLAVGNKFGSFFVYDRDSISSGPVQRINLGGSGYGQHGLIGVAAYWPATSTVFVSNPLDGGQYRHGVIAFRVTASCRLAYEWSASFGPSGVNSDPTVAAGVVFFGNGYGNRAVAFDARTGRLLWNSERSVTGHVFAAPTVVNGKVYVASLGGYLSAFGPAPQNTSPPLISGTATQQHTLTESHGSWTNNSTRYHYEWEDCDSSGSSCFVIAGATKRTLTLTSADVGHTIRVEEIAINASGASSPASSAATRVVLPLRGPSNIVPPSISGNVTEGQTLAETHGIWTNAPTSFTYQWQRCDTSGTNCSAIPGASSNSYAPAAADIGDTIRVQETASNGEPSAAPATSAPTAVVQPASAPLTNPSNTLPPVISGTTLTGQTLTGSTGAWSGTPPISFRYQWERCAGSCSAIRGATSSSYTLTNSDRRAKIAVVVTATNSGGNGNATSAQVGPVTAGPTSRQLKAALVTALKLARTETIGTLLDKDGSTTPFSAPSPGQLTIGWYLRPKGAHRPLLVATADVIFHTARKANVAITLTDRGRLMLEQSSRLKLTATATFTPAGGQTTTATKVVTLRQ
ncbi:MAG TPA: PQQ-binding-like beta-propeller repeat protein [Solirubrobacteraceae bacterium]|nr:PQQ-binding-like beta-propeller repeat protein [Solirubrobacteraceae bacterium]